MPKEERISFMTLPLKSGTGVFKRKKPVEVRFKNGCSKPVMTWKQAVSEIFRDVVKSSDLKLELYRLCGKINGKKRMILSTSSQNMVSPITIADNLFFESIAKNAKPPLLCVFFCFP